MTDHAMHIGTGGDRAGVVSARTWWRAGFAVAAVGWGANQFAPLLLLYRTELGLSAVAVNAAFGLYALGLIPGLLLGGPVSDRVGRRRVLVPAMAVSLLASVLLIAGGVACTGWLFLGRLVAGLASGAAFSAGAAWIKELSDAASPAGANPGPHRATVAMTAGFAAGPLVAGLLAAWVPLPVVLAYVPHLLVAGLAVPLALRTPETRTAAGIARPGRGVWLAVVRGRRFVTVVVPLAPWVFGSASVALAYLPGLLETGTGSSVLVFTAVLTALTALAGIAVQPLARHVQDPHRPRQLIATALGIVAAGLVVSAIAAATAPPARPVLVVAAVLVLGAGYGCCQVCGLAEVQRLAPAQDLAGLTAVYQALSYLGFAAPFLLAAAQQFASPPLLLNVAAALAVLTLGWTVAHARFPAGRHPETSPLPAGADTGRGRS